MSPMEGLARLLWATIPSKAHRLSRQLGAILSDGQYLSASPNLAVIVPTAAFLAGLLSGFLHPDAIFTASMPLTALLLLFACFGSGIGWYAWLGYMIGDLPNLIPATAVVTARYGGLATALPIGHVYAYLVLAMLIVAVPIGARSLSVATSRAIPGGDNLVIQVLLGAALMAGMVFLWCLAMPILVRPVYLLEGISPTVVSVATIQESSGLVLIVESAVLGGIRAFLGRAATRFDSFNQTALAFSEATARSRSLSDSVPTVIRLAARAVLTVLLLLGLMNSPADSAIAFVGVLATLLLASLVIPRLTGFTRLLERIPIVARLVAGFVVAFIVGYIVIAPFFETYMSMIPILISVLLGFAVMLILVPEGAILLIPKTDAGPE